MFGKDAMNRKWTGKTQRLVLAIDIGTTQTAVAVAYLVPGVSVRFAQTYSGYLLFSL